MEARRSTSLSQTCKSYICNVCLHSLHARGEGGGGEGEGKEEREGKEKEEEEGEENDTAGEEDGNKLKFQH